MKWISITDRLPDCEDVDVKYDDGTEFDATWVDDQFQIMGGQFYVARQCNGFKEFNISKQEYTGLRITHWKPYEKRR